MSFDKNKPNYEEDLIKESLDQIRDELNIVRGNELSASFPEDPSNGQFVFRSDIENGGLHLYYNGEWIKLWTKDNGFYQEAVNNAFDDTGVSFTAGNIQEAIEKLNSAINVTIDDTGVSFTAGNIQSSLEKLNKSENITFNDSNVTYTSNHAQGALEALNSAANVSFDPGWTGGVARSVSNRLEEYVSVKDFGAVGDGETDDTEAIKSALKASILEKVPLVFYEGDYLITEKISTSSILNTSEIKYIHLIGQGNANIISSGDYKDKLFLFRGNQNKTIINNINFYGEKNVSRAFEVINTLDNNEHLNNSVIIKNCYFEKFYGDYRKQVTDGNSSAFIIHGAYNKVIIENNHIFDIEASGEYPRGSRGFTIRHNTSNENANFPENVFIFDNHIEKIYREETENIIDCDGFFINTSDRYNPNTAKAYVYNNTIKNCKVRNMKFQITNVIINNNTLIAEEGYGLSFGPQGAHANITNNNIYAEGNVNTTSIVSMARRSSSEEMQLNITNNTFNILNTNSIKNIVMVRSTDEDLPIENVIISNNNVKGSCLNFAAIRIGGNSYADLIISNNSIGKLTNKFLNITLYGAFANPILKGLYTNNLNVADEKVGFLEESHGFKHELEEYNNKNIESYKRIFEHKERTTMNPTGDSYTVNLPDWASGTSYKFTLSIAQTYSGSTSKFLAHFEGYFAISGEDNSMIIHTVSEKTSSTVGGFNIQSDENQDLIINLDGGGMDSNFIPVFINIEGIR